MFTSPRTRAEGFTYSVGNNFCVIDGGEDRGDQRDGRGDIDERVRVHDEVHNQDDPGEELPPMSTRACDLWER